MNINMAGYYPYIIVTLLVIYSCTTNAKSKLNRDTAAIMNHLRAERDQRNSSTNRPDNVCSLNENKKQMLCDEVARHLNGDPIASLLRDNDSLEPRAVDIEGLDMSKPMVKCGPRKFVIEYPDSTRFSGARSDSTIVDGFFYAGSSTHSDRVYVFRPSNTDAGKVTPIAELNGWTP